jgi:hypothetical protein
MTPRGFYVVAIAAVGVAGCTAAERPAPAGPTFDVVSDPVVSGSVLGPDGNICNSLPDGGSIQILAIDVVQPGGGGALAGSQFVTCPQNSFTFSLPPSAYLLRARLPVSGAIAGGFPRHSYTLSPIEVSDGDVSRDIIVAPGTPLGGGVTVNGQPFPDIGLTLVHGDATGFLVASAASADGGWAENIGRPQTILQNGLRVQPNALCDLLGTRLLTPFSFAPFVFPDEKNSVSCDFVDAPATEFSHTRTRLVVTPGPGDVGAGQMALPEELGEGWGVQFPVNPGEKPTIGFITVSQLFMGGLVVGLRPDRVLSANELAGYFPCGPVCRDFGADARLQYHSSPSFGTKVTWRYSDASSSEGVGLKVVQKSYDGIPPADYVLFRFTLTNSAAEPLTFYPGFFADWDIDDDFFDDVGTTELDGRLMYMTNEGGGVAAGSLIVSDAPVSGNAFFTFDFETNDAPTSTSEFVDALAGDFGNPSAPQFGDKWYVHAIGPISLAPAASAQMWIAIVAGENVDQLRSNAAAAAADIADRLARPDEPATGTVRSVTRSARSTPGAARARTCRKGCTAVP